MSGRAKQAALSPTMGCERIRKMEKASIIVRRIALLDPTQTSAGLIVSVAIAAHERAPGWLASFASAVEGTPEVMEARHIAGAGDDTPRVAVVGMAEFDGFYKRLAPAVPVRNDTSRSAMERLKGATAFLPPPGALSVRQAAEPDSWLCRPSAPGPTWPRLAPQEAAAG